MENAIEWALQLLKDIIYFTSDSSGVGLSLQSYNNSLYKFSVAILETVMSPIAYTILALFFVLELQKISTRVETTGGGMTGFEIPMKTMFKMAFCKIAVDNCKLIIEAIAELGALLITRVQDLADISADVTFDPSEIASTISDEGIFTQFVVLIFLVFVILIAIISCSFSFIMITLRFLEMYVYLAISPIPLATLPFEGGAIARNFIKSFTAVTIQGILILIVLIAYPVITGSALSTFDGSLITLFVSTTGVSALLIFSLFATNRWAKSITASM